MNDVEKVEAYIYIYVFACLSVQTLMFNFLLYLFIFVYFCMFASAINNVYFLICVYQCDEWIKEASQFLLQVGRKATEAKTSTDAMDMITSLDNFRAEGAPKQDERLAQMYKIICDLYGKIYQNYLPTLGWDLSKLSANSRVRFIKIIYQL